MVVNKFYLPQVILFIRTIGVFHLYRRIDRKCSVFTVQYTVLYVSKILEPIPLTLRSITSLPEPIRKDREGRCNILIKTVCLQ